MSVGSSAGLKELNVVEIEGAQVVIVDENGLAELAKSA